MRPARIVTLARGRPLRALTATARGMIEGNYIHAAQRAFTEVMVAVARAGHLAQVRSRVGLTPDVPSGPNDPRCRYMAGVLFGHDLATGQGEPCEPEVKLGGGLAWTPIVPGRYAVFRHVGPYDTLHRAWDAARRDGLRAGGETLREDASPLELYITPSDTVPTDTLHTEIWIPVLDR